MFKRTFPIEETKRMLDHDLFKWIFNRPGNRILSHPTMLSLKILSMQREKAKH